MVFPNELLCCTLIFFWQWICTFLFSHMDIHQLTIHHDKVEYTFFVAMKHMNVYRLVLVGEEVKDKSKVFKYLRHTQLSFFPSANLMH